MFYAFYHDKKKKVFRLFLTSIFHISIAVLKLITTVNFSLAISRNRLFKAFYTIINHSKFLFIELFFDEKFIYKTRI